MKKKLLTGLLALSLLACLTACGGQPAAEETPAEEEETMESQPGGWEGDSIVYESPKGWSITMPASWEGRYVVVEEGDSEAVCAASSHDEENFGALFTIMRLDAADADELAEMIPVTPLADLEDGTRYVAVFPSDVQFNPEFAEDYEDLSKDAESVLGTFTLLDQEPGNETASEETPANTLVLIDGNSFTGAEPGETKNNDDGTYVYETLLPQEDGSRWIITNQKLAALDYDLSGEELAQTCVNSAFGEVSELTCTLDETLSAKMTYPVYRFSGLTGANEDTNAIDGVAVETEGFVFLYTVTRDADAEGGEDLIPGMFEMLSLEEG